MTLKLWNQFLRNNEIVFNSPAQKFTRCSTGCETLWNWKRPSECNLCEITGFTQEYGCHYFPDNSLTIRTDPSVASFDECIVLCKVLSNFLCTTNQRSFRPTQTAQFLLTIISNRTVDWCELHLGVAVWSHLKLIELVDKTIKSRLVDSVLLQPNADQGINILVQANPN